MPSQGGSTSDGEPARWRAETAVTVQWIAERLRMGSPGQVNHLRPCPRTAEGKGVANIKTRFRTDPFSFSLS
jgi:hypothetical protein